MDPSVAGLTYACTGRQCGVVQKLGTIVWLVQ
jgi:hypothetical protein